MESKIKILIIEDDPNDLEMLQYELKRGGINFTSQTVNNEQDYGNALKSFVPDIILSDYSLPTFDGSSAFRMREIMAPDTPFILVSGAIGEENSIELIKNGITDYALKDKLFTLTTKVKRALKEASEKLQKNKIEQERIQNERRLARAQQISHMGSWELDLNTNIILLSEEARRIYGFEPGKSQIAFETWTSLVHAEDLSLVLQTINESRHSLTDMSYHHRIVRNDGTVRQIYSESKYEFDVDGKPTVLYGIVHDVTELKMAEKERTNMLDDLMQRNKVLEQFAYIVSHNMRSPVANILGTLNAMSSVTLSKEEKEILSQGMKESVTKLDNVVKDLNHILQIKREINETKEKVHFSELVKDIEIGIKNLIDEYNVKIKYDFSEIDEIFTLKSYLYSIFYNLISNSIKYRLNDIPCVIDISSNKVTNKIKLNFIDNGMGIDLQKRGEQVFGLYKRFHTNIEGKGMGLYIVKTQVETLGGTINITSSVNKGTEFKIQFDI